MVTLGENIRNIRVRTGMSQKEAASLLNVSSSAYSRYEHDEAQIPTDVIIGMTEIYNVDFNRLYYRVEKQRMRS
ncbi:MAG: helix-turn-helix transcriptional regulator [Erysipelotrichaceae bacterium]|nr:helix-turn-helix transcriptional regulator [Erysipelotrichaceae bacterium]